MSNASIVSRGYETAAQLSMTFSRAVRDVKSLSLAGVDETRPSAEQCQSIAQLSEILTSLEYQLSISAFAYGVEPTAVELPDGLSSWLRATGRGQVVGRTAIAAVRERIQAVPFRGTPDDVRLLEHIERVIDAHAHHLFNVLERDLRGTR